MNDEHAPYDPGLLLSRLQEDSDRHLDTAPPTELVRQKGDLKMLADGPAAPSDENDTALRTRRAFGKKD